MPRIGFGEEDQRTETGHAVVVTIRMEESGKMRVLEVRRGSCGGRAGNFDSEVRAIREAVIWTQQNRVQRVLIRSDSTAAIQRIKDTRLGHGQAEALEIKKRMDRMSKEVHIE